MVPENPIDTGKSAHNPAHSETVAGWAAISGAGVTNAGRASWKGAKKRAIVATARKLALLHMHRVGTNLFTSSELEPYAIHGRRSWDVASDGKSHIFLRRDEEKSNPCGNGSASTGFAHFTSSFCA